MLDSHLSLHMLYDLLNTTSVPLQALCQGIQKERAIMVTGAQAWGGCTSLKTILISKIHCSLLGLINSRQPELCSTVILRL
jgi:hypothetical protein